VIGAGPVGGALAARLASAGVPTALVDRTALPPMEHPDFDGRAYAIAAGSRPLLEQAGLWERLPQPPGPILDIRISDGRIGQPASPLFLHFDHQEVGDQPFGYMIEARSLRVALNARVHELSAPNARVHELAVSNARVHELSAPNARVHELAAQQQLNESHNLHLYAPAQSQVSRDAHTATIAIAGGPTITAQLVIAADGRESQLRKQAGIGATRFAYRQHAVVCAIAHERPHHGTALEHFLPEGPFAQLPMAPNEAGQNISALVWTDRPERAARFMAMDEAGFTREISRRLGSHLGAVTPIGRRWSYPLSALMAARFTAPRLALVGDAAHGIHPIAGQGLNLGLRDATFLATLLINAWEDGEDLGSPQLLRRYQSARRPDAMLMLAATDALDRLFSTDFPPIRLARDLGIAAVHRMPRLKRFFMRQAMGAAQG